ncbi:MAG: Zn-dependent hydrolase, partial [Bacteroidota bacterium]
MQSKNRFFILMFCLSLVYACNDSSTETAHSSAEAVAPRGSDPATEGLKKYVPVKLTTDLSALTDKEKQMIPILIEAADLMNELFLYQAYGEQFAVLKDAQGSPELKKFIDINYGPWDRLNGNEPFVKGVGKKPDGANYYPQNMTKDEFEKADLKDKESLYTFLRRDNNGNLISVPYHQQFKAQLTKAAQLLDQAADLAEYPNLKNYLRLRSKALLDDEYQASDFAWLDMKSNKLDVVIGPIETYEDQLFGYKAAYEGYVLVKDMEWSKRLAKY